MNNFLNIGGDQPPPPPEYITLERESEIEYIEKKSVFIGRAKRVCSVEEAAEYLESIKRKNSDARHHVYAYQINRGAAERMSDDGEPQGTSGPYVLDVIKKKGFTDAIIVVTRYFGGILLGASGLTRAYSTAANQAAEAAGIVRYVEYSVFLSVLSYTDYQRVENLIKTYGAVIDDIVYEENVSLTFAVKTSEKEELLQRIIDMTAARALISECGTRFGSDN
ncbi:MAG: YigZ family protein [Clostridiales bacterium]|nr:YigZ family protein [Clostridiales bacterium]